MKQLMLKDIICMNVFYLVLRICSTLRPSEIVLQRFVLFGNLAPYYAKGGLGPAALAPKGSLLEMQY